MPDEEWLTPNDYAEIWHVVPQMVREYIRKGMIPAEKGDGGFWRLPPGLQKPPTKRRYKEDFTPREIEERRDKRRAYDKQYYQRYKDAGICYKCKKRMAEPGRTECAVCARRSLAYNKSRAVANKDACKERYERLKAKGVCTNCGRRKAVKGNVLCKVCKGKMSESQSVWRIKRRIRRENSG